MGRLTLANADVSYTRGDVWGEETRGSKSKTPRQEKGRVFSRRPRSLRDEPGEIECRTCPLPLLTVGARIVLEVKERWLPLGLKAFLLLTLQLLDTFRWRG